MRVNSILVIFKAMRLDEITLGGNVERKKQQALERVLRISNNRGRGENEELAVTLRLA